MINYIDIQGDNTSTDLNISVDGMDLIVEMSYFKNGQTNIQRQGDMVREVVTLSSDPTLSTEVKVYLLDDPEYVNDQEPYLFTEYRVVDGVQDLYEETRYRDITRLDKNEGSFVVWSKREGVDEDFSSEHMMLVCDMIIPPGLVETTETIPAYTVGDITYPERIVKHGLDTIDINVRRIV